MSNTDSGALSFKAIFDSQQLDRALDETIRRVQGLSQATAGEGLRMSQSFLQTSDRIRRALADIGKVCAMHEGELTRLRQQYTQLGKESSEAFMAGRDRQYLAIEQTRASLAGEIAAREKALQEARGLSDALENEIQKREKLTRSIESNNRAQQNLGGRIREIKQEMAQLTLNGIDQQSQAYRNLASELSRLNSIQLSVSRQGRALANLQGVIQGFSGLSGAISATTGAVSLFAGENESLRLIMGKVQSAMSIAIGMQSVAQTMNKDSAFVQVTLNKLKAWWAGVVAKATAAQQANTAANVSNTAATSANAGAIGAQSTAARTGTLANIGLAGAFRLVGAAIKSIPVFGWIIAGITALVTVVSHFASKAREARQAQREFTQAVAEGSAKSIARFHELRTAYVALGDEMQAKDRFVKEHKKVLEELGVSVRDLAEAENLFVKGAEAFVQAEKEKAKAMAYRKQIQDLTEKQIVLQQEHDAMPDMVTKARSTMWGTPIIGEAPNEAKNKKKREMDEIATKIAERTKELTASGERLKEIYKDAGIHLAGEHAKGSLAYLEQQLASKREELKELTIGSEKYKQLLEEINALEKQINSASKTSSASSRRGRDPFVEEIEKKKSEYEVFAKMQNVPGMEATARKQFAELMKGGGNYEEYLKRLRAELEKKPASNETAKQIAHINTELTQLHEGGGVLKEFTAQLEQALERAPTMVKKQEIIDTHRKSLQGDDTQMAVEKRRALDEQEQALAQEAQRRTEALLEQYASAQERKIELQMQFNQEMLLLEQAHAQATDRVEKERIERAMSRRRQQHEAQMRTSGSPQYDRLLEEFEIFEQKREEINHQYAQKRRTAEEMMEQLHKELEKAKTDTEREEIQKRIVINEQLQQKIQESHKETMENLSVEMLKQSDQWKELFADLAGKTQEELERLMEFAKEKHIEIGVKFNTPAGKQAQQDLEKKIGAISALLATGDPLMGLAQSFKEFSGATDAAQQKDALAKMFDSASEAGEYVKTILLEISAVLDSLGVKGTEEVGIAIKAIEKFSGGAKDAVMGFASGNYLQGVTGAITAIGSAVSYFAGMKDRRAERTIKKHQTAIKDLESSYKDLQHQINKSFGEGSFQAQEQSIENMKQQQQELYAIIDAERSKKKSDPEKIRAAEEQIKALDRSIDQTIDNMRKQLLATDAKEIATRLGDALVSAFENGTSAAKAWSKSVNDIVNDIVKNILVQKVIYEPVSKIANKYTARWVDESGKFNGFDIIMEDMKKFDEDMKGLYPSLEGVFNAFKDKMKFTKEEEEQDRGLTGAVKGVSQETASLIEGQLNAIRMHQTDAINILSAQLMTLQEVSHNTSFNRFLEGIHNELKAINSASADPLRAKGLKN